MEGFQITIVLWLSAGEGENLFPIKVSFGLETKEKRAVCWLHLADREPVTDQLINTENFKYTVSQKKSISKHL